MISGFMKEFSNAIPGIDEAMSFVELMKHMQVREGRRVCGATTVELPLTQACRRRRCSAWNSR